MVSFALALFTFVLAALAPQISADVFLGARAMTEELMSRETVEQALLLELSIVGGDARIHSLEEELRPLYAALPKNKHGNLEPSVARYALHRQFVQSKGWHVRGLERAGGAWNASLPANIMKDQAPSYIEGLLEQRLHGRGLSLQELAVFAATLSELTRMEALGGLGYLYSAMGLNMSSRLKPWLFDDVMKGYLVMAVYGIFDDGDPGEDLKNSLAEVEREFRTWEATTMWAKDLRHTFAMTTQQPRRNPFESEMSFEDGLVFVEELMGGFGSFHNLECHSLKERLMEMEHQGTGRVRLSKFYSGSHEKNWPFDEKMEYLRALGALDETDPARPSVVISNYLGGKSKCVAPSRFYSLCCLDECEGLMAHLERAIAGPVAEPARIAEIISALESDTVHAPRNLSITQLDRLEEIARHHDGHVPLHGRLFAQWMHHAYPRECHFPSVADTTNPLLPDEWMDEVGADTATASHMEIQVWNERMADVKQEAITEPLPWTAVEELITSHKQVPVGGQGSWIWGSLRQVAILAVVISALLPVVRTSKLVRTCPVDEGKCHFV